MSSPTAQLLAEAAARRHAGADAGVSGAQLMEEHEKRQNLRRMIDPGIFRPNSRQVAMDSLKASALCRPFPSLSMWLNY
ncbi:hypothetical protein JVT61DRAFT_13235 [Boletus reticuloceps]|uniref:Uncharacterized protein n=1 Tax=Boletus reticuloceps TaxID=495285 RepID=A0A8I2YTK2_9AGAM|nr:hypothetical protein JVT61DRAFT_13235 [Boletus reticuloceps]